MSALLVKLPVCFRLTQALRNQIREEQRSGNVSGGYLRSTGHLGLPIKDHKERLR
jgi:hypothetical protein